MKKGQSLIELLIAIALIAVILPALLTGFVVSRESKAQDSMRLLAVSALKELEESTRSIREKNWNTFAVNGTYHPVVSGAEWSLASGSSTIDGLTSQIIIASGSNASSKNITYQVSWTEPAPGGSISSQEILTRYIGNTSVLQTSQSDFDAGTKANTESTAGGTIRLKSALSSSVFTDDYTTPSDYVYDSNKIEVVNGYAQLKGSGSGSNSTLNPNFNSNAANWTFASYGDPGNASGGWNNSAGNPTGNVSVSLKKSRNEMSGGYWSQSFTTYTPVPTGTLTFDKSVTAYQSAPDSFRVYAWIDSGPGTPSVVVWDSGNITGTSAWATHSINVSSYITTPGTYYLKFGAYVDYSNANLGPFTVRFDNVQLSWVGASGAPYPSDSPTIRPTTSFTPSSLVSWDTFTATEITNGGSIRYQLSDDDGTTWYYWQNVGTGWVVAGATDYNSASQINMNINTFPITNGKLMVKAFLISDSNQLVQLDKIVIGFSGSGGGENTGDFYSSTIDTGSQVAFNRVLWTESNTSNTTTGLQVAINSDNGTWNYVGPDGTSATYFTGGSGAIPFTIMNGRYIRYKIAFTSSNNDIPSVSDVSINYSP